MPLSYGDGTIAEHRACRTGAVAFDVSHLGTVRVTGPGGRAAAPGRPHQRPRQDRAGAGPVHAPARPGRCLGRSTTSSCGGSGEDRFDVMPNASNTTGVGGRHRSGVDVDAHPGHHRRAGPRARELFPAIADVGRRPVRGDGLDGVARHRRRHRLHRRGRGRDRGARRARRCRLGRRAGRRGRPPPGLGARDTLRLEAGLPLHGHELGPGITPLQAGLGWVVGWDKGDFRGRAALEAERAAGPARRLRGLLLEGRRPPRADQSVLDGDGRRRRRHQRQLLADARARHRVWPSSAPTSSPASAWPSTCAVATSPPRSSPHPSGQEHRDPALRPPPRRSRRRRDRGHAGHGRRHLPGRPDRRRRARQHPPGQPPGPPGGGHRRGGPGPAPGLRRPQPGGRVHAGHGLLRHDHAGGHPAQRPGEPGLVHGLHAVPAGDLPGPPRGPPQLPDHGHRPHRAWIWPTPRCSTRPRPRPRPWPCVAGSPSGTRPRFFVDADVPSADHRGGGHPGRALGHQGHRRRPR